CAISSELNETIKQFRVSEITSLTSPTSVEIIGRLQAIASLTTFGEPSINEVTNKTSQALKYFTIVSCDAPKGTTSSTSFLSYISLSLSTDALANAKFFLFNSGLPKNRTRNLSFDNINSLRQTFLSSSLK